MVCFHPFKIAALAAALTAAAASFSMPAAAQSAEADFQLLNQIFEASNSIESDEPEIAREAYKTCTALGRELAARKDMEAGVRSYFEAEIEGCLSYAMYHGEFSDETGDKCSHHFTHAEKLAEAIRSAQNKKGVQQEQLTNLRDSLQRAGEVGPQHYGCTGDYARLIQSLPATDAVAPVVEAGIPNKEIMDQISSTTYGITDKDSAEWLRKCRSFSAAVANHAGLNAIERAYFDGQIENCIATTMARGNMSDETGDVCFHHHLFASRLAETLTLDTKAAFLDSGFREYVSEEIKTAARQGPGMGCKQDYEALKPK